MGRTMGEMGRRERETRERESEREETAVRDHLGPPNNTRQTLAWHAALRGRKHRLLLSLSLSFPPNKNRD